MWKFEAQSYQQEMPNLRSAQKQKTMSWSCFSQNSLFNALSRLSRLTAEGWLLSHKVYQTVIKCSVLIKWIIRITTPWLIFSTDWHSTSSCIIRFKNTNFISPFISFLYLYVVEKLNIHPSVVTRDSLSGVTKHAVIVPLIQCISAISL